MASVPVTIIGTLTNKEGSENVTLVGMASLTGLEVGGGPIQPPSIWPSPGHPAHPIAPGGPPPGIWPGPGPLPHPEHPIVLPPPIQIPPGIWPDPPEGIAPHPEHPIVIPPPAGSPPNTPAFEVKTIWTPTTGWAVILVPNFDHVTPST